jgi:phosphate:Na+ symporter
MQFILVPLDLAGYVALLLWGVHMVQTGVQRAFGARLGNMLGAALRNRARAFVTGIGITAILQSSTAVGLMITGFTAGGMVGLVPALAAMLGANVGTTLIVQVLSFDLVPLAPILVLIGVWMFRRSLPGQTRDLGRVFIGLGLLLLALHGLVSLLEPYHEAPMLRTVLGMLAAQPVLAMLLAAVFTWAAHSSVAVVLLVMSLAAQGIVPTHAAFALVLGANLGTAINPLLEGVSGNDPAARRLPLGNLLARGIGVVVMLPLLPWLVDVMVMGGDDAPRAIANFHTLFNIGLAVLLLPLLTPYAALLRRWLPERVDPEDPARPRYLDDAAHEVPVVALGNSAREALRLADFLDAMLGSARTALQDGNRNELVQAKSVNTVLDRLATSIKVYLSHLDHEALTDADQRRLSDIVYFATHMEHAGDIVRMGLLAHAERRIKQGWSLSGAQHRELEAALSRLRVNLSHAASLFVTDDLQAARLLMGEKTAFRVLETNAERAHLDAIKRGQAEGAERGMLYLDVLRDLKTINSHVVEAAAYPVLERHGELLPSRLRPTPEA